MTGTPLWKKLGVRPGELLLLVDSPRGWTVPDLPEGVSTRRHTAEQAGRPEQGHTAEDAGSSEQAEMAEHASPAAESPAETVVAFCRTLAVVRRRIPQLAPRIFPAGGIWIAWPRRAGGHQSDIRETDIRSQALPLGLVDVKVAALDDDWSGLRLVWRRERRSS